jgi:replicative DNA helicase
VHYRGLVHTPAQLAKAYVQWAEDRARNPGIKWGIPCIDEVMIPMHPGELTTILGRPGHGKSSILAYLARRQSGIIKRAGKTGQECVVYVTWENTVEELTNFLLSDSGLSVTDIARGKVDLEQVKRESLKLLDSAIFVIGRGIGRMQEQSISMTAEVVYRAIETMEEDYQVKPVLLLFDYLQLIPSKTHRERKEAVAEAPVRIKELAAGVRAPAVAAVQASREVDKYKIKLPEKQDAQFSSQIEQISDKMFSLWRPKLTEDEEWIELFDGKMHQVTDNLMLIRMLKQRFGPGRHTWAVYFDPAYLKLAELETRPENQLYEDQFEDDEMEL